MAQEDKSENNDSFDCLSYFQNIRHARLSADSLSEKAKYMRRLADKLSLASEQELYAAIAKGSVQVTNEVENLLLRPKAVLFSGTGMFRTLSETVLPDLLKRNADQRRIQFWVPGCGNGREVYSLALFLNAQQLSLQDWQLSVLGTDTSHIALEEANTARIPYEDIDSVIYHLYGEGLRKIDGDYSVKEETRRLTIFAQGNFYDDKPEQGPFDAIFFRGHLSFWEPEQQEAIIRNLGESLDSGGYLVLAHNESLLGLTGDFQPIHNVPGFYKKR